VSQIVLFYWYCLSLFWSVRTSSTAKTHLRVILLLKSITFAFSALQLRSGYPSPASYRCSPPSAIYPYSSLLDICTWDPNIAQTLESSSTNTRGSGRGRGGPVNPTSLVF